MDREAALREALLGTLDAAAIGSLTAAFAHAANNRLTVLLSCLDMLEASSDPVGDDARSATHLALEATQQLARDFAALLVGARRSDPVREPVVVDAALDRAKCVFEALSNNAIPVRVEPAPGVAVLVERSRFELCLLQLFVLAQRRGASAIGVTSASDAVPVEATTQRRGAAGSSCELRFTLDGASLPGALLQPPAEHGNSIERLHEPDGLEFAAVETFATSMRGRARALLDGAGRAVIELRLPRAEPSLR